MNAKNKAKQSDTSCGSQCVCLEPERPDVQEVGIAGSFNDWHPNVTPMIRLHDGKWAKELALPPGRYEYRFVVDGEWVDDPTATELIPNPFGAANAVLVVAACKSPVAARPASASPATRRQSSSPESPTRVRHAVPESTRRMTDTSTRLANLFRRASSAQQAVP
ncbi:MAG: glycogen-binding domain-containing protein [Limisphaerales bacterium]